VPHPIRLEATTSGLSPDADWMSTAASYVRFAGPNARPGIVTVSLSRAAACGTFVASPIAIRIARIVINADRQPAPGRLLAERHVLIRSNPCDTKVLHFRIRPPFRIDLSASRTFQPSESDRRQLSAQVAFVIAADVISKAIVVATMADHPNIRLLGGALTITLTRNGGAAFSIGTSMTIVFTVIALGVVVYILRTARNLRSVGWAITLGLLLGGATGNLLDRIFRAPGLLQGHVVDWIELPDWPVFNLADSAIVCAGVLVVLLALLGIRMDGTRPAREST
jgi:signal peptidase II